MSYDNDNWTGESPISSSSTKRNAGSTSYQNLMAPTTDISYERQKNRQPSNVHSTSHSEQHKHSSRRSVTVINLIDDENTKNFHNENAKHYPSTLHPSMNNLDRQTPLNENKKLGDYYANTGDDFNNMPSRWNQHRRPSQNPPSMAESTVASSKYPTENRNLPHWQNPPPALKHSHPPLQKSKRPHHPIQNGGEYHITTRSKTKQMQQQRQRQHELDYRQHPSMTPNANRSMHRSPNHAGESYSHHRSNVAASNANSKSQYKSRYSQRKSMEENYPYVKPNQDRFSNSKHRPPSLPQPCPPPPTNRLDSNVQPSISCSSQTLHTHKKRSADDRYDTSAPVYYAHQHYKYNQGKKATPPSHRYPSNQPPNALKPYPSPYRSFHSKSSSKFTNPPIPLNSNPLPPLAPSTSHKRRDADPSEIENDGNLTTSTLQMHPKRAKHYHPNTAKLSTTKRPSSMPKELMKKKTSKSPKQSKKSNASHHRNNNIPPYDDQEGHYILKSAEDFTPQYKILRILGQGTFGKVVECFDRQNKSRVAIKVIRAIPKYRDAAKIEVRVLNTLAKHDPRNYRRCIHLIDCFDYRNHICMVFELLGVSVYDFLKDNGFHPFPLVQIQSFVRQLLDSVAFIHDLTLIHTDLKPENILLVNDTCINTHNNKKEPKTLLYTSIRLIDFGSATFEDEYHSRVVSTRHYRAPEIILGLKWSYPCDLWSIGCILMEFSTGEALFQTHDNLEHLAMIERVIGPVPSNMIDLAYPEFFRNRALAYPNAKTSNQSLSYVKAMRTIKETIRPKSKFERLLVDLLSRMLTHDPTQRITVSQV